MEQRQMICLFLNLGTEMEMTFASEGDKGLDLSDMKRYPQQIKVEQTVC